MIVRFAPVPEHLVGPIILDTCFLMFSYPLGTVMTAAQMGLLQVHWSDESINELREHMPKRIIAQGKPIQEALQRTEHKISELTSHFPEALISDLGDLTQFRLDDADDRHVLAAAKQANAQYIVTSNINHFPAKALEPFGVRAIRPDDFLVLLLEQNSDVMIKVVHQQCRDYASGISLEDMVTKLAKQTPRFAALVREHLGLAGG